MAAALVRQPVSQNLITPYIGRVWAVHVIINGVRRRDEIITKERLIEIRKLLTGIYLTPWRVDDSEGALLIIGEAEALVASIVDAWDAEKSDYANAKFIAASPQIVDELLAEIEQLRHELMIMKKLPAIDNHDQELLKHSIVTS